MTNFAAFKPLYIGLIIIFANCPDENECANCRVMMLFRLCLLLDYSDVNNEYAVNQCVKSADLVSPAYKEYIISQVN